MESNNEEKRRSYFLKKLREFTNNTIVAFSAVYHKIQVHRIKLSTSNWIAVFAFVLSLIVFLRNCGQDNFIEKKQYAQNQIKFRPNVKVLKPEVRRLKISTTDSIFLKNSLEDFIGIDSNEIVDVKSTLEVEANLYLTNIGNTPAILTFEIYADTTSGELFLKSILNDLPNRSGNLNKLNDYYPFKVINPGDTIKLERDFTIAWIKDGVFTLHALILYENELEQVFETYYWCRFKNNPINMRRLIIPEKNIIVTQALSKDMEQAVQIIDDQNYTNSLNAEEGKRIISNIKKSKIW